MSEYTNALEDLVGRIAEERLFYNYKEPYDHSQPFGLDNVGPYDWQMEFHNAGETVTERLLIAGNRCGKTQTAAAEMACHATGLYPEWWQGKRFDKAPVIWCGSESWTASRDIIQDALLGPVGEEGTGWIPKEELIDWKKRQAGVSDVVETIRVKHKSGGISSITLKTYEQQRKEWMGRACSVVWFDEEPPMEIYTEGLTRILDKRGIVLVTFTNLKGATEVVRHFVNPAPGSNSYIKSVGWDRAPHLDEKMRAELIASYPAREIDARTKGKIMMGAGSIFGVPDEEIMVDPFQIPGHYARINGVDFGIGHPAATAWCAVDRESKTFYVYDCYKRANETALYHATALGKHGDWIPTAWPHDGIQRDKGTGLTLMSEYRKHGANMLPKHAQFEDKKRGISREAGLDLMDVYMRTGRFRVFSSLSDWFEEKRMYHRKIDKDGESVVVANFDDILCLHGDTNVLTRSGRMPIREMVGTEGDVLSVDGEFVAYKDCRKTQVNVDIVKVCFDDGTEIRCTANHLFLANNGWVRADELVGHKCYNSISCSTNGDELWSQSLSTKTSSSLEGKDIRDLTTTSVGGESFCIVWFMNTITEKFRRSIMFITSMATAQIIKLKTWSASRAGNIYRAIKRVTEERPTQPLRLASSGAKQRKDVCFVGKWDSEISTTCASFVNFIASVAANRSRQTMLAPIGSVPTNAGLRGDVTAGLMTSSAHVPIADKRSWSINTRKLRHAAESAGNVCVSVEPAGKSDVYCMSVLGPEAFAVENGVVVHNCATRYAFVMRRYAMTRSSSTVNKQRPSRPIVGGRQWRG